MQKIILRAILEWLIAGNAKIHTDQIVEVWGTLYNIYDSDDLDKLAALLNDRI